MAINYCFSSEEYIIAKLSTTTLAFELLLVKHLTREFKSYQNFFFFLVNDLFPWKYELEI